MTWDAGSLSLTYRDLTVGTTEVERGTSGVAVDALGRGSRESVCLWWCRRWDVADARRPDPTDPV